MNSMQCAMGLMKVNGFYSISLPFVSFGNHKADLKYTDVQSNVF